AAGPSQRMIICHRGTTVAKMYRYSRRREAENKFKLEFQGFSSHYAETRSLRALVGIFKGLSNFLFQDFEHLEVLRKGKAPVE
ncbi:hypothetical protein HAX54_047875, partial [Datura stramonium]|nr:hypothetical protein [Datura stramonium]